MGVVTDLPIRESTNPRALDPPDHVDTPFPSFRQWIKAGFALALGAWCAAVVLFIPTFILLLRFQLFVLQALTRALETMR